MELIDQLRKVFGKEKVLSGDLWREVYGRDASYFDIKPLAVVRPDSVDGVRQLLAMAASASTPVTFRAAGTSLSGQTVNSGIICELRTPRWRGYEVRRDSVWFEPGITAEMLNNYLRPHHCHIGPDPASARAAMMGGILANNSSGMSAGVAHNSYHTLRSIQFVLANGHRYDSSKVTDHSRFERDEAELCRGLMDIRATIMANDEMRNRIIRKYRIKNVTGYAMNSFVDFDNPMDIFAHLLIGSEGTLAFIESGELATLPLDDVYSSAMLYFPDAASAAAHAAELGETGARAVEMMDYGSLTSYLGRRNDMPVGTTAMLVDYGAESREEMGERVAALTERFRKMPRLLRMEDFTTTAAARAELWKMRDGIFPCVAGVRDPGATVILEDVAAPVAELDRLVEGVQGLFRKYGYDGAIFGHARDGNIHPLITACMDREGEKTRFRRFMDDFVDHLLSLDGSLKGEHGTGRAIAPFVAREWGDDIYALMKRVKKLCDPQGVLNPGVMINDDPDCFLGPMKEMTLFGRELGYEHADKCMECGYCEHVCPTRYATLTPRQRIQALRVIARTGSEELRREYKFLGEESCCADATCMLPCPLEISTAEITDHIRDRQGGVVKSLLTAGAPHYGGVVKAFRGALRAGVVAEKVLTPYPLEWATDFMHMLYKGSPHWSRFFAYPARIPWNAVEEPDFVYFPACVTRIFGASTLPGKDDLITTTLRVAERAGLRVSVPREMGSLCCSQIWLHKGSPKGREEMANRIIAAFYEMSRGGAIPIFCDTSSCTHTLLRETMGVLTAENREKFEKMTIMDVTTWLVNYVLPRLKVRHPKDSVLLHATCGSKLLGVAPLLVDIARQCAREVYLPQNNRCCGSAGDRGFIFPEIARSATTDERVEIGSRQFSGAYSLARTCEMSMQASIGRPYESIMYLVDEATTE